MDRPHFVIVGGGTAGWITAFIVQDSLRRLKIDAKVTVVEPSKIPTVGVGEATTAAFNVFLKSFGIDEFEFFRKTGATFKLGIRHEDWRRKGFTYYGPIDDPHQVVAAPPGRRRCRRQGRELRQRLHDHAAHRLGPDLGADEQSSAGAG
ncbi:MAG: tryptophan 7-halogenase, partial [Devosia sp.]|nr:tryptophan 7-halogenase [Devosia sp.]